MVGKEAHGGKKRRKASEAAREESEDGAEANGKDTSDLDVSLREDDENAPDNLEEGALKFQDIYIPPPPPSTCSFDNKGPRLIAKTIVVNNFKSFYGTHTIGPFFKGMSAVIGPNGSGKSNVLDSILFVFGYRASKIRTKKVALLIHNSSRHTNLQSCTVTVNFIQIIDKGPNVDPEEVPNTELVVSRTAMRDGSSYYTMDGKRLQFKDVAKKLRTHGVDLTNGRFLILQGEVEQIALMKPKGETEHDIGLLEFLEDIMGTLRYKEPLAKAMVLDTEVEEEREGQAERVNAAERGLKTLEEGKIEAVDYLRNENIILRHEHKICQNNIFKTERKKAVEEEAKGKVVEKLDEIKKELGEAHSKTKEMDKNIKQKRDELEKLQKKNDQMDKDYRLMKSSDTQMRENMTARGARRKKLRENFRAEEKKLTDLRGLPEKNAREIAELEKLIAHHEKDRATAQQSLLTATEGLQREIQEPQQKLEKLEEKLAELAKLREEKSAVRRINQSKLELCTKGETKQKEKLETLTKNLEEARANLEVKKQRMAELKKELPRRQVALGEASETLETERGQRARIDQQANTLRAELQGVRVAAEQAKHRNRVVGALMEQCANGNIPGIFGRLGDLGAIEAKYDCAISSSCGSLDHIVVDKVDTGERCINYLRDSGIGRGNFMVLEKLQSWGPKSREKMVAPENVPRLFDLVKVEDERVLPAFYFALRDTLVAKDIDQASRIGLGGRVRHRVVDLDGNIVEPGGTITGGGHPIKGRMGQRVIAGLASEKAAEDTPRLRQSLEQLEKRSSTLMENILKLEQSVREMRNLVPQLEAESRKLAMDIQHLSESVPLLEKQLTEQREVVKKTSSDQQQVKKLQEELAHSTEELQKATAAAEKIETQVGKLRKQMDEIKNSRIGGLDLKVKELTKKINKAQSDKTKLSAAIAASERNMQKGEEKMLDLEQEIARMETEVTQLKAELEETEVKAKAMMKVREECSEEILSREKEITNLREEQKAKAAEELVFKNRRLEVEQELEKLEADITKYKDQISDNKRKMKNIKLEEVPAGKDEEQEQQPLKEYTPEELSEMDSQDLMYSLSKLVEARKPRPNLAIIEEYQSKESQFLSLAAQLEEATQRRNEVRNFVTLVKRQRYQEFMKGFQVINQKLKEVFRMISMGGDAELELQDTFNPFLEGISFSVRPRNKAWTQIDKLSGGEKTLSSLALVFGLHYFKPSPFYMMDEIDAALDARNVSIIGHYITQFTTNCQFIVISLRPEMYDLFGRRVMGIYKPDGCSRCVCLDPAEFTPVVAPPLTPTGSQDVFDSFQDNSANVTMDDSTQEKAAPTPPRKNKRAKAPVPSSSNGTSSDASESPKPKRKSIRFSIPAPRLNDSVDESEPPQTPKTPTRAQIIPPSDESFDSPDKETEPTSKRLKVKEAGEGTSQAVRGEKTPLKKKGLAKAASPDEESSEYESAQESVVKKGSGVVPPSDESFSSSQESSPTKSQGRAVTSKSKKGRKLSPPDESSSDEEPSLRREKKGKGGTVLPSDDEEEESDS